jgi:hypothetical protein
MVVLNGFDVFAKALLSLKLLAPLHVLDGDMRFCTGWPQDEILGGTKASDMIVLTTSPFKLVLAILRCSYLHVMFIVPE